MVYKISTVSSRWLSRWWLSRNYFFFCFIFPTFCILGLRDNVQIKNKVAREKLQKSPTYINSLSLIARWWHNLSGMYQSWAVRTNHHNACFRPKKKEKEKILREIHELPSILLPFVAVAFETSGGECSVSSVDFWEVFCSKKKRNK